MSSQEQQVGPYQVVRYLTAGGMADLYLVRTGRGGPPEHLVLKRVQTRYLDNERVVAMFRDEAAIGSLLRHPNIVRVHGAGEADAHPYIAMEYIPGHDLVEVLRTCTARGVALPRELGVALCAQIARGLAYAHDLRDEGGRPVELVHCDISPGNVMLSWRGAVKLVDFGVARASIPLFCPERGVAGKYNYMAPEQVRGEKVDRRADLFALGVILWEVTCGRRLFRGRPEAVMRRVLEEPIPPPLEVCPDYPPELQGIVLRALQRDPALRYPTAESLRVDLVAWLLKAPRAHGKRELARFLRQLFPQRPLRGDGTGEESGDETVDLGARPEALRRLSERPLPAPGGDADVTTETPLGRADDREEALLTRTDNPLPRAAALSGPVRRPDPEEPDGGGITDHMLGDGATYPARPRPGDPAEDHRGGRRREVEPTEQVFLRQGQAGDSGGSGETALRRRPERKARRGPLSRLTPADRRLIARACAVAALLLFLAYFLAQR